MKIRTLKYIAKEGLVNAYRNKLMSLASIGIVIVSLLVFGTFLLTILNVDQSMEKLRQQPELEVFCHTELDDIGIKQVEQELMKSPIIEKITFVTSEEAFKKVQEMLEEDAYLIEGYDVHLMPASFVIALRKGIDSDEEVKKLQSIPGVFKVQYSRDEIVLMSKAIKWVNIVSLVLIFTFLAISIFIISNTIKLTVFSRRKEIGIMKYIGATDWFIRLPFIVEGVVIGLLGALFAYIITRYVYGVFENMFNKDLTEYVMSDYVMLIRINDVHDKIIVLYSMIGVVVGAIGSFVSIRRYLKA